MDIKWIAIVILIWLLVAGWREAKATNSIIAAARKECFRKDRHIQRLQNALGNLDIEALRAVNERCKLEWAEAHRRTDGVVDTSGNGIPELPPVTDD